MNGRQNEEQGDRERRIREKAYRLWEESGRPEGRALEHWAEAMRSLDEDEDGHNSGRHAQPQAQVPKHDELKSARADAKKAPKPGGRKRKPVSPGG